MSFTQAAEELNVTQAAVSHQIKSLEAFFNKTLFKRGNRSIELTEDGKNLLPYIDQAFSVIQEGMERLRSEGNEKTLTVSLLPSFAARWLVPRLGLFIKAHPDIDFRLAPSRNLTDFKREKVDIAIRHGGGSYPGMTSIFLSNESIFPVCAPSVMEGKNPLKSPSDLKDHVLIHDEGYSDWRKWLLAANVHDVDPNQGPVFTDSSMGVQSAIEGDGIALGRSKLVKADLARGVLIKPFDITQPSPFAYYIVYPEDQPVTESMRAFIHWILEQEELDSK